MTENHKLTLEIIEQDLSSDEGKKELSKCYFGIYVMQRKAKKIFRAGAFGIKATKEHPTRNAQVRLRECGNEYKYVFFAKANRAKDLYSAEAILYGKLCESFRGTKSSHFEAESAEEVRGVAKQAVDVFLKNSQYETPEKHEHPPKNKKTL